ncbi:zincin [Pluteus cervinus]|uniref:Zincin n=1 Tax=Pluteus cervinus TaxID=181527 RepID=A0ACD3B3T3_9AGAR|nr:zincin [Pluteus cervinus]
MFPQMSHAALLAIVASVVPVAATPSISLEVTGPVSISDIADFKVTTIIRNTGDETLALLEDPHGPLSAFPADTFIITNANGTSPDFTGYMIKFSPEDAVENGEIITLAPGEFKAVEHDLSEAYNFVASGAGTYNIEAYDVFTMVKDNKLESIRAISKALPIDVSGNLAVSNMVRTTSHSGHLAFGGCPGDRQTKLLEIAQAAQKYAKEAYEYLLSYPDPSREPTPRYTTWFGTDKNGYDAVLDHFKKINEENFTSFRFNCPSELRCLSKGPDVFAYVDDPPVYGIIHLCPRFWRANLTGYDSQAGTLIHEASHFTEVAATKDVKNPKTNQTYYGYKRCRDLALTKPEDARINADNHQYFAENPPPRVSGLEMVLNSTIMSSVENNNVQEVMQARTTSLWSKLAGRMAWPSGPSVVDSNS